MWTLTPTPTPGVVHKLFWTSSRRAKNDVFYSRMVGGYDWGMGWWGGGGGGGGGGGNSAKFCFYSTSK